MRKAARRILHGLLLLAGVSILSFALLDAAPGNFFDELRLNPQVSSSTVDALGHQYGMNSPMPMRYWRWLESVARGEFGYSLSYNRPVGELIWPRARNTLLLTTLATSLAWLIALPWGILEALSGGGWIDRLGSIMTAILLAIPDLLFGLLLLLLATRTGWFPVGGMASIPSGHETASLRISDSVLHLVLPVAGLVLGTAPILVRHVRSAMAQVLGAPFIDAARGQGIAPARVVFRYALPVAANPLISLLGFSLGALLSMSLLIEVVLGWPGLGPLVLEAMLSRDIYVVIAAVMLSAIFLVVGNLLADVLLYWADPRIRTA
jgi:peptide/nickel transport system permease protein